ncbi:MAG: hypothetical protein C4308_11020 [Chitinophagaceae bacterium]
MQFHNLSYSTLLDTVNHYTRKFIHFLLVGGGQQELIKCKKILDSLIKELQRRRTNKKIKRDAELVKPENNLNSLLGLIKFPVTTFN